MKKAFTIVELLVVVAIIGILLGIVGIAAASSMKGSRSSRAKAMAAAFEQAIAAYHAQDEDGDWPDAIEDAAKSMEKTTIRLEPEAADKVFREIVEKSVGSNVTRPLIDASALFVARASSVQGDGCNDKHGDNSASDYCGNKRCVNGVDFSEAVKNGMKVSEMAFGWQGVEYGKFRRFWITYNAKTDTVKVSTTK